MVPEVITHSCLSKLQILTNEKNELFNINYSGDPNREHVMVLNGYVFGMVSLAMSYYFWPPSCLKQYKKPFSSAILKVVFRIFGAIARA